MEDLKEDEHTEFKEKVTKEMMKTVVAFSNSKGGHLLIGVRDDGTVAGLDDPDGAGCQVSQLIAEHVRPDVTGNVSIMSDDSDRTLDIIVPEGSEKPYYLRDKGPKEGGVYIRQGPASIPAKEPLIRKLFRDRMELSYESMFHAQQDLTFERTSDFFSKCGLELGPTQMNSLHMTRDGMYTNLAYLLSDQCSIGIKLAVYRDEYKTEFIDRTELYGSVLGQVDDALAFIMKHNSLRSRITGLMRNDSWKFPIVSVREVLMNAVVHRDYTINGDILVSVFGDKMSVNSLGGLPPDIGMEEIRLGISSPRNPNLASVFYRLRLVESFGTGIPRVMSEYRDNVVMPEFTATTNAFSVILPAIDMGEDLSGISADILRMVAENGSVTRSYVESSVGVSKTKAFQELSLLVERGFLVKIGKGRGTRYVSAVKKD